MIDWIYITYNHKTSEEGEAEDENEKFKKELELNYDKTNRAIVDLLKKASKRPPNLRKGAKKTSHKDEKSLFEKEVWKNP